jgi:hypothetical protein
VVYNLTLSAEVYIIVFTRRTFGMYRGGYYEKNNI